jgi:hypothetical protein
MKIAYIGGLWSRNIGNSFYNIGTECFLKKIGVSDVYFIPDPPQWECSSVNGDFDLISILDVDLVILTGPCLNLRLDSIYGKIFKNLKLRNIPYGFLSAGMSLYDEGEAGEVQKLLNNYPPNFIFTRDDLTAALLRKAKIPNVFEGICTSMYLNEAIKVPTLNTKDYIVINFDLVEPVICGDGINGFSLKNRTWFDRNKYPSEINGLQVIRTRNDSITIGEKEIYSRHNTYHSDLPYGYLSILKSAKYVLSERVHTCAASTILGSAAQYIPHSSRSLEKRMSLFNKVGLNEISLRPQKINYDIVNSEKALLESTFSSLLFKR